MFFQLMCIRGGESIKSAHKRVGWMPRSRIHTRSPISARAHNKVNGAHHGASRCLLSHFRRALISPAPSGPCIYINSPEAHTLPSQHGYKQEDMATLHGQLMSTEYPQHPAFPASNLSRNSTVQPAGENNYNYTAECAAGLPG